MRKIWSFALMAGLMVACGPAQQEEKTQAEPVEETKTEEVVEEQVYPYQAGAEFDRAAAIKPAELSEKLASFEGEQMADVVLEADINSVCKKKGCWMKVGLKDGEDMRVSFKDYEFFVPTDSESHNTVISGVVFKDTIGVDMLKHLAEDAGETEEAIAKITEPEIVWAFEATGVYVD